MTLALVGRALSQRSAPGPIATARTRRFVDHAKVVIAADLGCRRALADIATEVGLSPIYLTQIFQHVEGIPMYRYQLRLRLARALELLGDYDDVTDLALSRTDGMVGNQGCCVCRQDRCWRGYGRRRRLRWFLPSRWVSRSTS